MMIKKIRLIEPGNAVPFKKSLKNLFTYNQTIRNPSTGLIILTTLAKELVNDTLMYSESISKLDLDDCFDADLVCISISTYNAVRGYEIANIIRERSDAFIVFGGMHASLNPRETAEYADYVFLGDGEESLPEFIQAVNRGEPTSVPGIVYLKDGELVSTGVREQPDNLDIIPDWNLVYHYSRQAKRLDTLWPQIHASRGCPHTCAYCAVIQHFGRKIRHRSPESVVEEIRRAVLFHKRKVIPRINTGIWITDDNFAHDREWAVSVLEAIIRSGIKGKFTVQARFEIGFDDELLDLMKKAGFFEVAIGIEFVNDESFEKYRKKSASADIIRSICNIKKHGLGVRGLFIVGSDFDYPGIGEQIYRFTVENGIHGVLIQSMFFTPGTPVFEDCKNLLIHRNWSKYCGHVVHYPKNMKPSELQQEIIYASRKIYSGKRLLQVLFRSPLFFKMVFIGEFFWHKSIRKELKKEWFELKKLEQASV